MIYDNQPLISKLFPLNNATSYGSFAVNAGASTVQPGIVPSAPITISFETWDDISTSAGISRLYGGIHALSAHQASQTAAVEVDGAIQTTWNILTDTTFLPMVDPLAPIAPLDEPVIPAFIVAEDAMMPVEPSAP